MVKLYRSHILVSVDPESILYGAKGILQKFERLIKEKGLEEEVRVIETGNLGIMKKGVVVVVYPEGVYYVNVKSDDVDRIVEEHIVKGRIVKDLLYEGPVGEIKDEKIEAKETRIVLKGSGEIEPLNIEEYIGIDGFAALGKALTEMKPEDVVEEVKKSGLRGRGGAGFPTGLKWSFTASIKDKEKFIVCNADEGEPGTFKDRLIMEGVPYRLIEGMILAGYAVGAHKGYIYVRGEYALSIERLEKAIETAKKYNLLGDNILETGFSFDIEIRKGAGAYVCGEETALIESMEGKRGNPRNKPPYPGVSGFRSLPTVVNNVETLANVPAIVLNGADWYRRFGTEKSPGTKVYTIIGDVVNPGLIEVPMGTPLKDIIYKYAGGVKDGKEFLAALIGGAAGAFIGKDGLDVNMDYDSLGEYAAVLGSGAILVMDETRDVMDILTSIMKFFRHESCGKCSPCRIGTDKLLRLARYINAGKGSEKHWEAMKDLSYTMKLTAFCPLGQSPYLPISSVDKYLRKEVEKKFVNQ